MGTLLVEAGFSQNPMLLKAGLTKMPIARVRFLDTWQGRSLALTEARGLFPSFGLEILDVENPWSTMMWLGGRKK